MTRTVLVPSSLTREARDKREATRKLGYVARAATVFRVDRLVVYPDRAGQTRWGDGFVPTVLAYAATPPYLRKDAWGRRNELEYVGVLPPLLATPRTGSGDTLGSSRQGIVTEVGTDGHVRVNCGLQHPISLLVPPGMVVEEGERVTVRISSREPLRARIIDEPLPGLTVEEQSLTDALERPDAGVRIASSRYGEVLTIDRLRDLHDRIAHSRERGHGEFTAVFGAPERGLPEILNVDPPSTRDTVEQRSTGRRTQSDDDTTDTESARPRFDLWLNTVPHQGSETIRTEEALFATLSPLNLE